jgi:hypothetical protein
LLSVTAICLGVGSIGQENRLSVTDLAPSRRRIYRRPFVLHRIVDRAQVSPASVVAVIIVFSALNDVSAIRQYNTTEE